MTPSKAEVMKQIERLFSNTARSQEETLSDLEEISEQVQGMMNVLEDEI